VCVCVCVCVCVLFSGEATLSSSSCSCRELAGWRRLVWVVSIGTPSTKWYRTVPPAPCVFTLYLHQRRSLLSKDWQMSGKTKRLVRRSTHMPLEDFGMAVVYHM
jgi:hypothetical protein